MINSIVNKLMRIVHLVLILICGMMVLLIIYGKNSPVMTEKIVCNNLSDEEVIFYLVEGEEVVMNVCTDYSHVSGLTLYTNNLTLGEKIPKDNAKIGTLLYSIENTALDLYWEGQTKLIYDEQEMSEIVLGFPEEVSKADARILTIRLKVKNVSEHVAIGLLGNQEKQSDLILLEGAHRSIYTPLMQMKAHTIGRKDCKKEIMVLLFALSLVVLTKSDSKKKDN